MSPSSLPEHGCCEPASELDAERRRMTLAVNMNAVSASRMKKLLDAAPAPYVVPRTFVSYSSNGTEGCLSRQSALGFGVDFFGSL